MCLMLPKRERAFWLVLHLSFRIVKEELLNIWVCIKKKHKWGKWGWRKRTGRGMRRICLFSSDNLLIILCLQHGGNPVQTLPWETVTGTNYAHTEHKCP